MFKNREKIMARVAEMPPGEKSPTDRYWCLTCKMLFSMEEPVCPYMPKICINTPIPVEQGGPESTICLEKIGLFYPKIPQKIMSYLASGEPEEIARQWVNVYLDFLEQWRFAYRHEPLQAIKSFIISIAGSETGQRVRPDRLTMVLTDLGKVWEDEEKFFKILAPALTLLKNALSFDRKIELDSLDILGDMETGKYFCPMCSKFFEFSTRKDSITCPLMAQKCMAVPTAIDKIKYDLGHLVRVYHYTPDIYRRFITVLSPQPGAVDYLRKILTDEWRFAVEDSLLAELCDLLGLKN
ncbi:MAG TPA: hypothetical protein ENN91_04055 [Firmicutes bacterium]|nr:hypothetical protein [Bacillota bacterium]